MTEQFGRNWRLNASIGGKSLDTGQLRFRFDIHQKDSSTPHYANIYITNPNPQTIQALRQEYKQISLAAGYGRDIGTIFSGEIMQVRNGREIITDTYVHILATSAERARNDAVVNKALAAGHTWKDRVDLCTKAMKEFGITIGHIDDLGSKKFPRGYIAHGMARDVLREVCTATGSSWHNHNGEFTLLKNENTLPGDTIVLNSGTGMVGLPEQTLDGVVVRCLLNHKIRPGQKIQINEKSVQRASLNPSNQAGVPNANLSDGGILGVAADGLYKALLVEHNGDSRGLNWYTEIVCIKADGGASPSLYGRGIAMEEGN